MNCQISPWTRCRNKPHNIGHSEGSHSCSWTHTDPHWWQNHFCIHILLHKVCCSSLMQEGQSRLLDKHWCMDCNDYWEGMKQLKNKKRHWVENHNSLETMIKGWDYFELVTMSGFLKLEIHFLFWYQKTKKKTFYKKKARMFNTYILDVKHLQIQVKTTHLYTRSSN